MTWKTGDSVVVKRRGEERRGRITLASSNGASLWLEVPGLQGVAGHFVAGVPVLRGPDGVYRDLIEEEPVELHEPPELLAERAARDADEVERQALALRHPLLASAGDAYSQAQRRANTLTALAKFEQLAAELDKPNLDMNPLMLQVQRDAAQSMIDDLREQLAKLNS